MLNSGTGVLLVSCDDQLGVVARTTSFFFEENINIVDAEQHSENGKFFQRIVFECADEALIASLSSRFSAVASGMGATYTMECGRKKRVAILASKTPHCTLGVLQRWHSGDLNIEPVVVIGGHPEPEEVSKWFGVPFLRLPAKGDQQENELLISKKLEEEKIELVVLARYMKILSAAFCETWSEKCINVHHSFLPAFVGASPYRQAYDRGVKVIGATAHYVTAELDAGPIISQRTLPVTHRESVAELTVRGRELEVGALVDAVAAHVDNKVIVDGSRTIIFH